MSALVWFLSALAVIALAVKLNDDDYGNLLVFAVAGMAAVILLVIVPMAIGEDNES